LSTLTKVLIVLLTVFSIFLCGIVVTYVANAENYKKQYEQTYTQLRSAREYERNAQRQLKEKIAETDEQIAALKERINSLTISNEELQAELDNSERQKASLEQRLDSMAASVKAANQTASLQTQLFENAQKELETTRVQQIEQENELKQITATLNERMAIISQLRKDNKRLLEEKAELEAKLNQSFREYGKTITPTAPVTPKREIAQPVAQPVTKKIGLKGSITNIDLKNKMASISIGSAHGVIEGMKFHVTRGAQFICDILIFDVQPEQAVGILELLEATKQQPQIGDRVNTNL
jgi:peptidoglycan hydrolase CwlO-like protein